MKDFEDLIGNENKINRSKIQKHKKLIRYDSESNEREPE